MPEYLSPGVYVEEVATGNQPIEGVSTSTTGLVGVTERGPVNVPQLVTSFGEYRRTFGGYLDRTDFTVHCYTPHAVEGFFTNGGKRAWVTRVVPEDATRADRRLFFADDAVPNPETSVLLRPAEAGTGTAANLPLLYALDTSALNIGDVIRIGDGSRAEYRQVMSVGVASTHVSFGLPLQNAHAVLANVRHVARAVDAGYVGAFALTADTPATSGQVSVSGAAADITWLIGSTSTAPQLLEVGSAIEADYVLASSATVVDATHALVTLATPLQRNHLLADAVTPLQVAALAADGNFTGPITVSTIANVGDAQLVVTSAVAADLTNLLALTPTTAAVIQIGIGPSLELVLAVSATLVDPTHVTVQLSGTLKNAHAINDAVVPQTRTLPAPETLGIAANAGELLVYPSSPAVYVAGDLALVDEGGFQEVRRVGALDTLAIAPGAYATYPAGSWVERVTVSDDTARKLAAPAAAGAVVLSLDNRVGLQAGDVVRIGVAPNAELLTVKQVSDPHNVSPDAGTVIVDSPLRLAHAAGDAAVRQNPPVVDNSASYASTVLDAVAGATMLLVSDGTGYVLGDLVRITVPGGGAHYHTLAANAAATSPREITLQNATLFSHATGAVVDEREELFVVRALDPGAWGNRLLVSAALEPKGLLARAEVKAFTASPGPGLPSTLHLSTVTGVEPGTVIQLLDNTGRTQVGATKLKVRSVNRAADNLVVLDDQGLQPDHITAIAAAPPGAPVLARSFEFRLDVLLLQPPSAAVPSRNNDLLDGESFRLLSMDPRHSHYFERVIGSTFTDGAATDDLGRPVRRSDRRSEGASQYVRVRDAKAAVPADLERIRVGPEALTDTLPSGLVRAARLPLGEGEDAATSGNDSVATMDDTMYTGNDDDEPVKRTGIYALKNVQDISLVAVPGQTTPAVQQGLIEHCEALRYRFAVLDSVGPAADAIADVEAQRQQYDTKYAALYYPWLTIPDPFPDSLAAVPQLPIPPSGHVLGIYARSDDERGVHKAPANEVVRGITGLTRYLQKGEQDVLNPYPVNIDVIRDFRPDNRGIRVWGARCITSDTDYKYVNVRRLLIFLEDSIDRGLQWVVFEPNAEPLWARVRRSITNFLTTVWRNGALEGITRDQAFFVKCDRTTMTQDDIDNGRFIVLIGVAPVKPAEFVIIRIGLFTADTSS